MKFSDETLMAYADGELDAESSARVEAAAAADPAVARAIARHRAVREQLQRGFDAVLEEAVPDRLLAAVHAGAAESPEPSPRPHAGRSVAGSSLSRWSWPQWGAIAASLAIGVLLGIGLRMSPEPMLLSDAAGIVAGGDLASALTNRPASESDPGDSVRFGPSFRAAAGQYCRSFAIAQAAGLACREQGRWRVELLASAPAASAQDYRMAGTELPKPILDAIEDRMDGEPLDAAGEAAAVERGWTD